MSTSTSSGTADDVASKKKSILIMDMPPEFVDRDILKKHFDQFGQVQKLACSVSKRYAIVDFATQEEAENAAARGAVIRPDAPRLKIVNRAVVLVSSKKSSTTTATAPPPTQRLVTRRKIVRNPFSIVSAPAANTSAISQPQPSTQQPSSLPSASYSPHVPLRSGIRISRPSPFLKKRSSFGDRTGKPTKPSPPKNPFALPPRSKLSLDNRKKTLLHGKSKAVSKPECSSYSVEDPEGAPSTVITDDVNPIIPLVKAGEPAIHVSSVGSSPLPSTSIKHSDKKPKDTDSVKITSVSVPVDFDETTEDALITNEDDATQGENENQDDPANDIPEEADDNDDDENTQEYADAEATTEEEGEILDDDDGDGSGDDDEEDPQDDDEPYESPMKRAEIPSKSVTSMGSEGRFSFKISAAEGDEKKSSSSFKAPFTSPFSSESNTSAPKPFSSSSFGKMFGNTPTGSSIFSGGSDSALSSSQKAKDSEKSKVSLEPIQPSFASSKVSEPFTKPKSSFSFAGSALPTSGVLKSSSLESSTSFPPVPSTLNTKTTTSSFGASVTSSFGASSLSTSNSSTFGIATTPSFSSLSAASSFGASASVGKLATSNPISFKISSNEPQLKPSTFAPTIEKSSTDISNFSTPSSGSLFGSHKMTSATSTTAPSTSKAALASQTSQQQKSSTTTKDTPNHLLLSFYPDSSEAQELFAKKSNSVEERYRILEARDKIIRTRVPKAKVTVEFATKLIGTCPDMCPEKERYMRQFQRQLVSYETIPGGDSVVDHQKAVKVYSRSSADQEEPLPHELRPGPTLDFTMHYLLRYIVPLGDNPDENLGDWYNFLWDRTRSIRKDITQQQITDLTAVSLYEKCTRFHIHCASRLCELDMYSFDSKLNDENLMKCLQSLEHLYDDLRRREVTCPNEPEFRAYQILMNLNEGDALYDAQQLPRWILNSPEVQVALKLHHSIYTKNFAGFFKMVLNLPYMTSCITHRYFFQVRSLALRCLIKAHCTLPKYENALPMSTLQRMLGYGSDQALSFSYLCEAHGIHCDVDEGKVILKRKMFYLPDQPSIYRETYLIDLKLCTSVAEAINGGLLPNIDFTNHKPNNSFNDIGQLIAGEIVKGVGGDARPLISTFVPPVTNLQVKILPSTLPVTAPAPQPSFSLGLFQKKRELPLRPAKPKRDIEAACQIATSKLIEESIQIDVAQLSYNQMEEAKKLQEKLERKQQLESLSVKLSAEYIEQTITNQVDSMVQRLADCKHSQFKTVESVSQNMASAMIDENVLSNVSLSAKMELNAAKELHHRLILTLERIFGRIRARFAFEKWKLFSKSKILVREKEEELRREQLWNFPAINPYSQSTKDVFRVFCGKSTAQPSVNKVDILSKSPENVLHSNLRVKRKSDGDENSSDHFEVPNKMPKLDSTDFEAILVEKERINNLWEFPVSNPYKTNRQVLEDLCGNSSLINLPVSPKITGVESGNVCGSSGPEGPIGGEVSFKIRKPISRSTCTVSEEIRSRTSEGIVDLLNKIKGLVNQVKEESKISKNLQPYFDEVKVMQKTCSELSSPKPNQSFFRTEMDDNLVDGNSECMDYEEMQQQNNFIAGVFLEEEMLLSQIKNFAREVKREKTLSWDTNTFLSNIDLDDGL